MGLSTIMNLTQNMTNPDAIIQSMDVTGLWGEFFLLGIFIVMLFAPYNIIPKFSKRLAVSSLITFALSTMAYAVEFNGYRMIDKSSFLLSLFVMIGSIIYLYIDTKKDITSLW